MENIGENFSKVGIKTHTESLKESLSYYPDKFEFDVVNPSSDHNINKYSSKLEKYDGLIWGGSSLNIYNDTDEIRRQIDFMKECQKKVKNILAILEAKNLSLVNIVKLNVYLKDLNDFSILNETFIEFFGKTNFPARSTVEVAGLPLGARVEIDCIAIES